VGFPAGNNANPNGRPVGSKNKINRDFYAAYEEVKNLPGYQHPLRLMYQWAMDPNLPIEVRAAMLKEFASYLCHKPKQTIAVEQTVPVFANEAQAETFLAEFIAAIAPDLEPAELAAMTRQFITSKREGKELELKAIKDETQPVRVEIIGGLPPLPNTNIIMPHNGHAIEGHRIAGQIADRDVGVSGDHEKTDMNSGASFQEPQSKDGES
jgi:hypothetical protein